MGENKKAMEAFNAIAGDDGMIDAEEFERAIESGAVRIDISAVPRAFVPRLHALAAALEATDGALSALLDSPPPPQVVSFAGIRHLGRALNSRSSRDIVRWHFFLADADGSHTLDAAEARVVWHHLWHRFVSEEASEASPEEGWAAPQLWPGKTSTVAPCTEEGPRSTDVPDMVWSAIVEAADGASVREASGGGMGVDGFLQACEASIRLVQIGFALGLQVGVVDPATGKFGGGERPRRDDRHPEMLRFMPSEYDALRASFVAKASGPSAEGEPSLDEDGLCRILEDVLPTPELRRSMFRQVDADRSGHVTFDEFARSLDSLVNGRFDERLKFLFRLYDEDASGDLCINDLRTMVNDALQSDERLASISKDPATEHAMRALLMIADTDKSGTLGEEEVANGAEAFVRCSSRAVAALPPGAAFSNESRRHPMERHPTAAVLLFACILLTGASFNLIFDGPGLLGPRLNAEFGWSVGQITAFMVYYQAFAIPGNLACGPLASWIGATSVLLVTNLLALAAIILQAVAVQGDGSYVLHVISRCMLGATEGMLPIGSVILGGLISPSYITVASSVKTCVQFGIMVVSRAALGGLSFSDYHVLLITLQVAATAGALAILLLGPRFGFSVNERRIATGTARASLAASFAKFTSAPIPRVRSMDIMRLSRMFWLNTAMVCCFFGVFQPYTTLAPFWFTLRGDTLEQANAKVNVTIIILLVSTVPFGAMANHAGFRAHIYTASFVPGAAGLLLAAFVPSTDTWIVVIVFSLGWGGVTALSFGLLPHYEKDTGLHGTGYGLLMALSSLAMMLTMVLMSAIAPGSEGDAGGLGGAFDFYRSGAIILGFITGAAVPCGLAMVFFDRKRRDLKAGHREKMRGDNGTDRAMSVFVLA